MNHVKSNRWKQSCVVFFTKYFRVISVFLLHPMKLTFTFAIEHKISKNNDSFVTRIFDCFIFFLPFSMTYIHCCSSFVRVFPGILKVDTKGWRSERRETGISCTSTRVLIPRTSVPLTDSGWTGVVPRSKRRRKPPASQRQRAKCRLHHAKAIGSLI